jgi:hypothetical protein
MVCFLLELAMLLKKQRRPTEKKGTTPFIIFIIRFRCRPGTGIKHSAKRRSQFIHATLPRRLGHRALVAARLLCLSLGGG